MPKEISEFLLPEYSGSSDISSQQLLDLEMDLMSQKTWSNSESYQTNRNLRTISVSDTSEYVGIPLNFQTSHCNIPGSSLSPFSAEQQMIRKTNCHLTSGNLLQIYHDVLEHNLSCWLTEMTCPYQVPPQDITTRILPECGSTWSNRIFQRTVKLDRVARSCGIVHLTRSEDQAASKALHLAIMAFATQWAQGSHRYRQKYSADSLNHHEDKDENDMVNEFDRGLQRHFWDDAQRQLQDVANLESFKVACAELIFGLAQKPLEPDDQSPGPDTEAFGRKKPVREYILSQVYMIICKEGPPTYMERAARKMHTLKYRFDTLEKGSSKQNGDREKFTHNIASIGLDHRATIGLLYWLAIMVDTLSSSMNERPVVVPDEDCQHAAYREKDTTAGAFSRGRWDLNLFVQGSLEGGHRTHWPCTYEDAAQDIVRSAPVKVLLFRHLSYLQNAVRKGSSGRHIEEKIDSTVSLYDYWNKTHGAFFEELVQNYSVVPHRIQGWFVCIFAHWHLAVLMLADLIELIDERSLAMEDNSQIRINTLLAKRIRKHSAEGLSDLARIATPPSRNASLGVPQMPEFHSAVNEATLLTEPWTMILIRAFTKAFVILLNEADEALYVSVPTPESTDHNYERYMTRAEDCRKGLWLLGKKSDMARDLAEKLLLAF